MSGNGRGGEGVGEDGGEWWGLLRKAGGLGGEGWQEGIELQIDRRRNIEQIAHFA